MQLQSYNGDQIYSEIILCLYKSKKLKHFSIFNSVGHCNEDCNEDTPVLTNDPLLLHQLVFCFCTDEVVYPTRSKQYLKQF